QDPKLRKLFAGKPEYVINFMQFVAQEVRELMAELGFRRVEEMIGRADFLKMDEAAQNWKTKKLDLSPLLAMVPVPEGSSRHRTGSPDHDFSQSLDGELVRQARTALEEKKPVSLAMNIKNSNRTVGATLSAMISRRYGSAGLPEDTVRCK